MQAQDLRPLSEHYCALRIASRDVSTADPEDLLLDELANPWMMNSCDIIVFKPLT